MQEQKAIDILNHKTPYSESEFVIAKLEARKALERMQKLQITLANLEAEAEFCHNVSHQMENDKMYEAASKMLVKEEAFRGCIGMIKEDLGLM